MAELNMCIYATNWGGTCDNTCAAVAGGSNLLSSVWSSWTTSHAQQVFGYFQDDPESGQPFAFANTESPAGYEGRSTGGSWQGIGYCYAGPRYGNMCYLNKVTTACSSAASCPDQTGGSGVAGAWGTGPTDAYRIFFCACKAT